MKKAIEYIKSTNVDRVYLNASPTDGGINLHELVGFYKSFGFEIIPELDKWSENKEMLLKLT